MPPAGTYQPVVIAVKASATDHCPRLHLDDVFFSHFQELVFQV